jgi:electron transport complex protein RnfC
MKDRKASFAVDGFGRGIADIAPAEAGAWSLAIAPLLAVPLSAHPVEQMPPIRGEGTAVLPGERLTDNPAEAGHAPLAPVAGTIGKVRDVWLTNGHRVPAVELVPNPNPATQVAASNPENPLPEGFASTDRGLWIDRLRQAGVWADRITSPDLIAQLHQSLRRPIDTVICNLLDNDRELLLNEVLTRESTADLVMGATLLARISGASRLWAAAPTGPTRTFNALAAIGKRFGVRVSFLANEYPLADPTILLYRMLNRRLRPRRLPTEQGVLLFDAPAAIAAGQCARQQPMLNVPIAIHDHIHTRSHFVRVPVGTPLNWALDQLQCISNGDAGEVRAGALLRDHRINVDSVIAGGELTIHVFQQSRYVIPDPCIRCSWCVEGCPTRIHPAGLLEAAQKNDVALAERYGIEACIECGVCSYMCPSHLPLLAGIRQISAVRHAETVKGDAS